MSAPITLVGRLGRDPEMKFGANGGAVVRLSLVTSSRRRTETGWEDADTTWWTVTAFKGLAENVAESLTKGDRVVVVGKVRERTWETPEGEKRSRMEVIADSVGPELTWAVARPVKPVATASSATGSDPWAGGTSAETPF